MAQEAMLQPYQNYTRATVLEGRLNRQERTLGLLLEQALSIKEEVSASLCSTQGSVQVEALSRRLLESHIHTITHIVKHLSVNIQELENQIIQRDSVSSGTSGAIQSLDQKNMAGIGDLRGRVARCDASITKLSADAISGERRVLRLQQEVMELRTALDMRLKEMELKLHQVVGRLEASLTEQSQDQKRFISDLQSKVTSLEASSSSGLVQGKEETESLRQWTEQKLHNSQQIQIRDNQQLQSLLQDKMLETESRLTESLRILEARLEQDEDDQRHTDQLRRPKTKLSRRMSSLENSLRQELQLVKQDYHKGFKSVHDAIESLRQIGDTQSQLAHEKLQKDMRRICRRMVELGDLSS